MCQCLGTDQNPVFWGEGFCVPVPDKVLEADEPYIFRLHLNYLDSLKVVSDKV